MLLGLVTERMPSGSSFLGKFYRAEAASVTWKAGREAGLEPLWKSK